MLALYLRFRWNPRIKFVRKEIYNLRNSECQDIFKLNTTSNQNFIQVLKDQDIEQGGSKWLKEIKHQISKSFKKIKISEKGQKIAKNKNVLFCKREKLKWQIAKKALSENDLKSVKSDLKAVEDEIADNEAEENFKVTKENLDYLVGDTDNLNCIKMWQLRKNLSLPQLRRV